MDALAVELLPQRATDRFVARYDEGSELLALETANPLNWPHGTTLDGLLTLDLDPSRVLVHSELTWPRNRWPSGSMELPEPNRTPRSLRLPSLSAGALHENPEVSVLRLLTTLVISWGEVVTAIRVPIGDGITALVAGGRLSGFVVETRAFD